MCFTLRIYLLTSFLLEFSQFYAFKSYKSVYLNSKCKQFTYQFYFTIFIFHEYEAKVCHMYITLLKTQ